MVWLRNRKGQARALGVWRWWTERNHLRARRDGGPREGPRPGRWRKLEQAAAVPARSHRLRRILHWQRLPRRGCEARAEAGPVVRGVRGWFARQEGGPSAPRRGVGVRRSPAVPPWTARPNLLPPMPFPSLPWRGVDRRGPLRARLLLRPGAGRLRSLCRARAPPEQGLRRAAGRRRRHLGRPRSPTR